MTAEDNEGIRELFAKYCHYVDAARADEWASLFVEDGSLVLNMGGPPLEGAEALRSFVAGMTPGRGMHLSTNPIIAVDRDEATAESYVLLVGGGGDPKVRLGGRYEDRLRRVDGQWRFVRRELHIDFTRTS